jgi:hypothetical protein
VYTVGRGIQSAIDNGSLVGLLHANPVPPAVPTYLLAGGSPNVVGIVNENRGPSDGVVFVASALDARGITAVADTAIIAGANHLQLGWAGEVAEQVAAWLD